MITIDDPEVMKHLAFFDKWQKAGINTIFRFNAIQMAIVSPGILTSEMARLLGTKTNSMGKVIGDLRGQGFLETKKVPNKNRTGCNLEIYPSSKSLTIKNA